MMLYGCGSNGSGQLGVGHLEDVSSPTCHELSFDDPSDTPAVIRAGGNHTLILLQSGTLYCSGVSATNYSKYLDTERKTSQTALLAQKIRLCSATWEASVIVDEKNELMTWGNGERGEIGRDTRSPHVKIPIISTDAGEDVCIMDVASGVQHTVIVYNDGQVWGWGNGRKGQLGHPASIVKEPRKIADLDFKVTRAVCGREFTFLVGDPAAGQCIVLGSDKWGVTSQAPNLIVGWKEIGACWGSIFVLLQSRQILSWGRNDHGQLAPRSLPEISNIACGSEHCLALTASGQVLAWGWGEHGNCGTSVDKDGDVKDGWTELKIPGSSRGIRNVGIGAGCATSWIWTSRKET